MIAGNTPASRKKERGISLNNISEARQRVTCAIRRPTCDHRDPGRPLPERGRGETFPVKRNAGEPGQRDGKAYTTTCFSAERAGETRFSADRAKGMTRSTARRSRPTWTRSLLTGFTILRRPRTRSSMSSIRDGVVEGAAGDQNDNLLYQHDNRRSFAAREFTTTLADFVLFFFARFGLPLSSKISPRAAGTGPLSWRSPWARCPGPSAARSGFGTHLGDGTRKDRRPFNIRVNDGS